MAKKNTKNSAGRAITSASAQKREAVKKGLRQTTATITISLCALALGVALIALNWLQNKEFSIVGAVIVAGMIANMVPAVKKRHQLQDEIAANPHIYM